MKYKSLCAPWTHSLLGPLQSRVVMSAMTRDFAGPGHTATEAMAEYYERRAVGGVGLILTEGTIVDPSGDGYRSVPHIQTPAQVASWRQVTARVHAAGARIFCQLWHCGRISHPDFLSGAAPVSSSDRQAEGINRQNDKPYGVPRRLRVEEIPSVYSMFQKAAANAMDAGFDGVELHLGHGYLADQFFDSRINDRTDDYGGSVENRCRFAVELTERVVAECGPARVMARISPAREMNGPYDWPDLDAMLDHLLPALSTVGLRLLDVSCARANYFETSGRIVRTIRPKWPHGLIAGASLAPDAATQEIDAGLLDMVTWGRLLIANPGLVAIWRDGRPVVPFVREMLDRLE